jgi:hypothetical protein
MQATFEYKGHKVEINRSQRKGVKRLYIDGQHKAYVWEAQATDKAKQLIDVEEAK